MRDVALEITLMAVARCVPSQRVRLREWQRKTLKCLYCGRMDRCIQQYLKQYVSTGPCNTRYGT